MKKLIITFALLNLFNLVQADEADEGGEKFGFLPYESKYDDPNVTTYPPIIAKDGTRGVIYKGEFYVEERPGLWNNILPTDAQYLNAKFDRQASPRNKSEFHYNIKGVIYKIVNLRGTSWLSTFKQTGIKIPLQKNKILSFAPMQGKITIPTNLLTGYNPTVKIEVNFTKSGSKGIIQLEDEEVPLDK